MLEMLAKQHSFCTTPNVLIIEIFHLVFQLELGS